MKNNKPYRFIISCGGTGGHIYPAIAVANLINKKIPVSEILFVGARGKMEMKIVPQFGFKIVGLPVSGIQRKLTLSNLIFPLKMILSIIKAFIILKKFKPNAIIGFGGYASSPIIFATNSKKIPIMLHEQNSYPGLVNRYFSKKATAICVAYDNLEIFFPKNKIKFTGNPVREKIISNEIKKEDGLKYFNLATDKPTILVLGGSLGAYTINQSILHNIQQFQDNECQIIWQTGSSYYDKMIKYTSNKNQKNFEIIKFIDNMEMAYASSDIIISRAGALTISELCVVGKPVILIPSPNVTDDHQMKNAMYLKNKEAAIVINDKQAINQLGVESIRLLKNKPNQRELSKKIKSLGTPKATEKIVSEIIKLIN